MNKSLFFFYFPYYFPFLCLLANYYQLSFIGITPNPHILEIFEVEEKVTEVNLYTSGIICKVRVTCLSEYPPHFLARLLLGVIWFCECRHDFYKVWGEENVFLRNFHDFEVKINK